MQRELSPCASPKISFRHKKFGVKGKTVDFLNPYSAIGFGRISQRI
jgi:hypothetical protein